MSDTPSFITVLTPDRQNLFSLSYKGFSGRREMFCMLGWYFILKAVLKYGVLKLFVARMLDTSASLALRFIPIGFIFISIVIGLFCILFVVPLFVRRARQMGAAWYGALVAALHILPVLGTAWLTHVGSYEGDPCAQAIALSALVAVFSSLPLYLYGGTFSGKKTALMRAAIAGDMERVRCLSGDAYGALGVQSDRGLTARDYALRMGHTEIADYLSKLEQEHAEDN